MDTSKSIISKQRIKVNSGQLLWAMCDGSYVSSSFFYFFFWQLSMKKRVSSRGSRSTIEDSRFRGTDNEKEAMNSVIGQQTANPTIPPLWLPLCLSLVLYLNLSLRAFLFLFFSLFLSLPPSSFDYTGHTHARSRAHTRGAHTRALARTYACCSVTLRGNAASRNMWPWTSLSRGFLHGNREKSCWPRDAISYTAVYLAKREK